MQNLLALLVLVPIFYGTVVWGQTADDCSAATTLVINDPPATGQVSNSYTTEANEVFGCAGSTGGCTRKTGWYRFNTDNEDYLWLRYAQSYNGGCGVFTRINVYGPYNPGGGCLPVISENIACQAVATNGSPDGFNLSGLQPNMDYLIQIVYYDNNGQGGQNRHIDFEISIETPLLEESTCNTPIDTGCTFATPPTVTQVVNNCEGDSMEVSHPDTSHSTTYCYEFTAGLIQVQWSSVITSNCGTGGPPGQSGGGNIESLSWDVFESGNCGTAIDSGEFPDLTIDGLTVGNVYVLCYEFVTPQTALGCEHSKHRTYFVGANNNNSNLLPIEFIYLNKKHASNGRWLQWTSNDISDVVRMILQISDNGKDFTDYKHFEEGTLNERMNRQIDNDLYGKYVRIAARNYSGKVIYSNIVYIDQSERRDIDVRSSQDEISISWTELADGEVRIHLTNIYGGQQYSARVQSHEGRNEHNISTRHLGAGTYVLNVQFENALHTEKVIIH